MKKFQSFINDLMEAKRSSWFIIDSIMRMSNKLGDEKFRKTLERKSDADLRIMWDRLSSISEETLEENDLPILEYFQEGDLSEEDICEAEDCDCDENDDDCNCEEIVYDDGEEPLDEMKFIFRVTSRGQKIRKLRCKPGFRVASVGGRLKCVRVSGKEKMAKRRAIRKAVRTKRAKGSGYKKRIVFKRKRAIRKRKAMGLKNQRR